MKMEVVVQGFPGKRLSGSLAWSSVTYIESDNHKILFDTGGPNVRSAICKHLQYIGVSPEEISILVISHFHDDHVRNFDYFPKARILLHEVEANWALTEPDDFAIPQHLFPALQKTGRLELIKKDSEILPGIATMLVPGHTPGSMAIVLRSSDMPVTVITGDAVKNLSELATGKVDKSDDHTASAKSIKKIRDIAEVVIPGHDRILKVTDEKVIALTAARQTLIIPSGVANPEAPRYLELTIEPTSLEKKEIIV
jgi:glyoxylase-like metal-dependent hydrolase (beta-lactamase superfamily II)